MIKTVVKITSYMAIILFANSIWQISSAKPNLQVAKRRTLYHSWLVAAGEVATKSNDQKALELYHFIRDHGILAEPIYDSTLSIRFLEGAKPNDTQWVAIIPTMATDKDSGKGWKNITTAPSEELGHYEANYRAIVLNFHDSLSIFVRGLVALKETYHAKKFINAYGFRKPPRPDINTRIEEEKQGFAFVAKIAEKFGGKDYEQLIEKEVKRIKLKITTTFQRTGSYDYKDSPPSIYDSGLEKIFGPIKSEIDLKNRRNILWMTAFFRVIDGAPNIAKKEETKNEFIKTILLGKQKS